MQRQVIKNNIAFTVTGSIAHWDAFQDNTWESNTFSILDKFLRPDDIMIDIGAWIGPISLYAAQKVRTCYSYEPDPVAFQELSTNLKLNPALENKIFLHNAAITIDGRPVKLYSRWNHGDSGSSLLRRVKSKNTFVEVASNTFSEALAAHNLTAVDFIKMDIEGGEFIILPSMIEYLKQYKPTLLISFHFAALCENYELKYFPHGILRRIYRTIDPNKKWIQAKANKHIHELLGTLNFYTVYDDVLSPLTPDKFDAIDFKNVDMLLFTQREPNRK